MARRKTMSNLLLVGILVVLVIVNAYFTYRKATDLDDTGRKLLAASQLIYLVFVGVIFLLGWVVGKTGLAAKLQSGSSTGAFIAMVVIVGAILAVMVFCKSKLEKKIREEHKL